MSVFSLTQDVIGDYSKYVRSFLQIADDDLRRFVEHELLEKNTYWPDALVQLNPSYAEACPVEDLCGQDKLHSQCADIFFDTRKSASFMLYQHQKKAIEIALRQEPYIVTSGTGSGKTLTYFIPIFDHVLRHTPQEAKVHAIVVYPMNALVNSQLDALQELKDSYEARTGKGFPVSFAKYTGQEREKQKTAVQQSPPHILLTNYVMLELMLVRPRERPFVDRTSSGLSFIVLDELHTYRGRQGADVGMLMRRLRERCGNPDVLCIGTSATMVAGKGMHGAERRRAVASFATAIFGAPIHPDNVVEEKIKRTATSDGPPTEAELAGALQHAPPDTPASFLSNPLTCWIEHSLGIETEPDGNLRRRTPITLEAGAVQLAEATRARTETCGDRLREMLLAGSRLTDSDGVPLFSFKIHQFLSQGRAVFATLESTASRLFTLEGQSFAKKGEEKKPLYPLQFCRVCGQEYYTVCKDNALKRLLAEDPNTPQAADEDALSGYLMLVADNAENEWNEEHLPAEWFDNRGRLRSYYRECIPQRLWVKSDGSFGEVESTGAVKSWFQPKPFMLCLACGEVFTRRDKDFRKLATLSSEGRSTATTVVSASALSHAVPEGIQVDARKVLSFTDNRQDASLQAGHFNDFVMVSLIRAAIASALEEKGTIRHDQIAETVVQKLDLPLHAVSASRDLKPDTPRAKEVWADFGALIEYRIYEDLRRGWRVIQPNLEQCALLDLDYHGLQEVCSDDAKWEAIPVMASAPAGDRKRVIKALLDQFRRKLALNAKCLQETYQQQLRRRAEASINEQWGFDEKELLRRATRVLLPDQEVPRGLGGVSISDRSLIGRRLRQHFSLTTEAYDGFIMQVLDLLCAEGFLRRDSERGVTFVQIDAGTLVWRKADATQISPDFFYSRQASGPAYREAERKANEFFRELYQKTARSLTDVEAREHTAQIKYDEREERERRFKSGDLAAMFCSPTMELGIDISDLQLVHMRNAPPTPANYAQRSGRAGRKGDPALIMTYCGARSGHDQYYFRRRDEMVAGAVRAPKIDLANEELVAAHLRALWLAKVSFPLQSSVTEVLDLPLEGYPLQENAASQIVLPEPRLRECIEESNRVLASCQEDLAGAAWYSKEWVESVIVTAATQFDRAFDRWRELYRAADQQWREATEILRHPTRDKKKRHAAERQRAQAERQKSLLCNFVTSVEESDFYPYRYLASEGFLPGYNFPRLPIRAFIPRGDGEFISRPRFLALTEFGPQNIIYHNGTKYEIRSLITPPEGLDERRSRPKLCNVCGYYLTDATMSRCENCDTALDASNSEFVPVLEMPNVSTWRRDRINCDEEERLQYGYSTSTYFRFAQDPGGRLRTTEAILHDKAGTPFLRFVYAPTAFLYRINHKWRRRKESGFTLNLDNGEFISRPDPEDTESAPEGSAHRKDTVRLYVRDTKNILLIYAAEPELFSGAEIVTTLQYALRRGIETAFQVEESELASELVGDEGYRAILLWEASEGGTGVLRRLVEEREAMIEVAQRALELCHFDAELKDQRSECVQACYDCLLSYYNQRDHLNIDRHLVAELLHRIATGETRQKSGGRSYEEHYAWLKSLTDSRSDIERGFLGHIFKTKRRLPDEAQKQLSDYYAMPDFFYTPNVCVFCHGSVHKEPKQMEKDRVVSQELRERGYRVLIIWYDQDLETQIRSYRDVLGEGKDTSR